MTAPVSAPAPAPAASARPARAAGSIEGVRTIAAATLARRDHTPPRQRPGITDAPARRPWRSRRRSRHFVDDRLAGERLGHGKPHEPARRKDREPIGHPKRLLGILGEPEKAAPSLTLQ